jgi:hypothetical protein
MNERIYELFFKAGGDRNTLHVLKLHTYFDPQEFANLIIKECSDFVYKYPHKELTRNQAREVCLSMEKEFGIEENE